MTTYLSVLPGDLPITIVDGNDLSFNMDWATDTTLYTFTAWIQPVGTITTPIPLTISIIDALIGKYTVSITKTLLAPLPLNISHKWRMDRTISSATRTVLAGTFTVLDK